MASPPRPNRPSPDSSHRYYSPGNILSRNVNDSDRKILDLPPDPEFFPWSVPQLSKKFHGHFIRPITVLSPYFSTNHIWCNYRHFLLTVLWQRQINSPGECIHNYTHIICLSKCLKYSASAGLLDCAADKKQLCRANGSRGMLWEN